MGQVNQAHLAHSPRVLNSSTRARYNEKSQRWLALLAPGGSFTTISRASESTLKRGPSTRPQQRRDAVERLLQRRPLLRREQRLVLPGEGLVRLLELAKVEAGFQDLLRARCAALRDGERHSLHAQFENVLPEHAAPIIDSRARRRADRDE